MRLQAHPEEWLQPFVFFHKLFYHLLCCAESVHTSSHTDSASSRWKTEPSFPPARGRASLHSFHNKDFQMFSRLDGSSCCVATPPASWIMSWHRQFSFWNINKAVISAARQAGAPAGLLPMSSMVPPSLGQDRTQVTCFCLLKIGCFDGEASFKVFKLSNLIAL